MLGHTILGKPSANPMKENTRRDNALKDGTNLKLLLSYIRNSSGRHDKGRHAEITYLKELASSKHKPKRRSSGSQGSTPVASPMSPTSSTATTIGLDGQSLYTDKTGSENSPAENVEPLCTATASLDVIDRTLMLLGLDPCTACSQDLLERVEARFPREVYAHVLEEDVGQAEPVHDCDEMEGGDVVESTLQVVEPPAHVVDHVQPTSLVSPPMAMVCVDPTLEGPVEEVVHPPVVDTDHVKESQTGASMEPPRRRYRTKAPALDRPMTSEPLQPPHGPEGSMSCPPAVVNPLDQLKLVEAQRPKRAAGAVKDPPATKKAKTDAKKDAAPLAAGDMLPVPEGMPEECMPPEKRGKLSYTIQNSKTAAKVEVLLKHKAFHVVKISVVDHNGAPLTPPIVKQRSWNDDIAAAWQETKVACGWRS
ncbi:unnamed protein product [Cladocopium goreaui]|uniref:Uncharacterized protein n=1 Tax=Cladocopium goreaui TaxID=2562237 RepID=A0A9P1DM49_9DINO|nr:unnamed protein product [Cladocopium goreaui]